MNLISTVGNEPPEHSVAGFLTTSDGVSLRYARWKSSAEFRGTICLLSGRAEFIEKYFETVRELQARGFNVVSFDWRGQGLSQRALTNAHKGHVKDFSEYDIDLQAIVEQVVLKECQPPLIAFNGKEASPKMVVASLCGTQNQFCKILA